MSLNWLWARNPPISTTEWLGSGMISLFLAVFVVAATVAYQYWSKREFYKLAAKIPGPPPLPFIGNAFEYYSLDHSSK